MTRRNFLNKLILLGAGLTGMDWLIKELGATDKAFAIGRPTQVDIAYLTLTGAEPNPRPGVIELMLLELARNTSVDVAVEAVPLAPSDPKLFNHP